MIAKAGVIVVSEAVRTRAAEASVRERLAKDKCVCCPEDDQRKHVKRGQCPRCSARFEEELSKLSTDAERAEYEAESYRRGLILNPQEIREIMNDIKRSNVFVEIRKSIKKR